MRGKKLAALSPFAASTVVLSACSGPGELTLDVPDVPIRTLLYRVELCSPCITADWRGDWGGGWVATVPVIDH